MELPLELARGYENFSYGLLDRDNLRESLERVASFADECPVGYKSLGGNIMSDASAVPFKKKLFVFVRGIDSKLYYRVFQKAKRGEWLSLDGNIISNPATYFTEQAVFVEVTGADGQRYHRSSSDGETFTEWKQGSVKALTTTPTLTIRGTTVNFKRGNGANPPLCVSRRRKDKRNNNPNNNNGNGNGGNNTQSVVEQTGDAPDSSAGSQLVSINQTDGNERGDRNGLRRGGPSASVLDEIGEFGVPASGTMENEAEAFAAVRMRSEDPCDPWWYPGCDDPPPPQGDQYSPNGVLDGIDVSAANNVNGWSFDPDSPALSNDVHVYFDGPAGSGTGYGTTANWSRPDLNAYFGISGDHGFNFQIPAQYADGQQHVVYAYGIDTGLNSPSHLNGSPKYFTKDPPPPATPSWGTINSISQTQLDVYWNVVPNATAYNLKMDGNIIASNFQYVSIPVTGLAPGSTHTFEVQAVSQWGTSGWSSPLSGTTQPPVMPATPTWGAVQTISQSQLDLHWNAAANATAYNVRMDGSVILSNFSGVDFAATGLAPGSTHTFEIQGVNQYGVSAWSDSRSGTTLPAPTPTPPPTPTPTPTPPPPGGGGGSSTSRARLSPKNATGGTNLYSRNFGWGTGLAGLSGRGLDAGFGISYNSLVWVKNGTDIVFNPNNDNVTPGFRFGFPVFEPAYADSLTQKNTYLMISPSGARTEFRQVDGTSDTFETADSSYLQIKVLDASTLVLYGTDGSQMTYTLKNGLFRAAQIKDANGNFVTVNHDNNGLLQSVTDTLGRVFNVSYDAGGQPLQITQAWANGTHVYATFTYTTQTINTNFSGLSMVGMTNGTNIKVLDKITFADNSETRFEYNSYGQVWRVSNYAADTHKLSHTGTNLDTVVSQAQTDCPRFTEMKSWAENFNTNQSNQPQEITIPVVTVENQPITQPNNVQIGTTLVAVTTPDGVITNSYFANSGWLEGMPVLIEDYTVENGGFSKKRWNWTNYTQDSTGLSYILNPRVIESKVGDNANVKRTTVYYRAQSPNSPIALYGLVEDVTVHDTSNNQLKRVHTDYNLDNAYISRRVIGLPAQTLLYDENNQLMSKATYQYDEGNFGGANQNISPVQHDNTNYGAGFIAGRGNLTSTTRWDVMNATNGGLAVTSQVRYDTAGSPVAKVDPAGRTVSVSYADSFDDNQNRNSFAYPTVVTDPAGFSSTVRYRFDIGANVYAESPAPAGNPVGKKTSRIYDALGRLERETIVNTGAYTRYEYPNNGIESNVYSTITDINNNGADGTDEVKTYTVFDGAGRVINKRTDLPGSQGGLSAVLTRYDVMGRVRMQSVPTEVDQGWNPSGDDASRGWLWTQYEYDWKGRTTRVVNTDGTDKLMSYEGCGCAGGQVTTVSGEQLAEGRRRQKVYEDILGRSYKSETLNWDGSVYSTVRTTFNGRDQATSVIQYAGADTSQNHQDTTMAYDGHGRLKQQHRPEQDANTFTTYNYNPDDSIQSVVDARGASTNYTYNSRRLVEQISYAIPNGSQIPVTPTVAFSYDNLGNRTQMTDGMGAVTYEYNQLSQLTAETRFFNDSLSNAPLANNGFRLQYTYSLSGQMSSFTDPYGQQINYAHDKVGRLNNVTGSTAFAGISTYASNPGYRAWGGLKHLEYGNGVHLNLTNFNNKLQATGYEVQKNTTSIIKKQYQFYNDGSLAYSQNFGDGQLDRLYKYDQLGRTIEAKSGAEARGQTAPITEIPYHQQMNYDSFGHMTGVTASNYESGEQITGDNYVNNRVASWTYDAEGNALADDQGTYVYDAAGKMIISTPKDANNPSNVLLPSVKYADGTGLFIKQITNYNASNPSLNDESTTYYIRSSVFGGEVLTRAMKTTQYYQTYVRANGTTLATQTRGYLGYNLHQYVSFPHQDASGASLKTTNESGQTTGTVVPSLNTPVEAEFDAFGQNAGASNPYVHEPPDENGQGGGITLPGGETNGGTLINGRVVNHKVDGMPVSRSDFTRQLESAFPGGQFSILERTSRLTANMENTSRTSTEEFRNTERYYPYGFIDWSLIPSKQETNDNQAKCDFRLARIFGDDDAVVGTEKDPPAVDGFPDNIIRDRRADPTEDPRNGVMHLYPNATGTPRRDNGQTGNLYTPKGFSDLNGKPDYYFYDNHKVEKIYSNIQVTYKAGSLARFDYKDGLQISFIHAGPVPNKSIDPVPIRSNKINKAGSVLIGTIGADGSPYDGGGNGGLAGIGYFEDGTTQKETPRKQYIHNHMIFYRITARGKTRVDPRSVFCKDLGF